MNKWTQIPSACATSIKETWRPFSPATSSLLSLSPFFPSGLPWEGWTLFGLELKFRGRGRSSINLVSYIFGGLRFLFLVFLFLFLIFLLSWRRCSINLASKNFTPKRLPLAASNNLDPKMRFSIGKSPDVTSSPFKGRLIKPCKQLFLTAPATRHELGNQKFSKFSDLQLISEEKALSSFHTPSTAWVFFHLRIRVQNPTAKNHPTNQKKSHSFYPYISFSCSPHPSSFELLLEEPRIFDWWRNHWY